MVKIGMDLITTIVAHKGSSADLDWDAGYETINTLTEDDVDLNWLENYLYDLEVDEDDNVDMVAVHARIKDALDEAKDALDGWRRDRNEYMLFGVQFYIFGEMSWGDVSEIHDELNILYTCPKVMEAVGLLTDFSSPVVSA